VFGQAVKKFLIACPRRGNLAHHHEIEATQRFLMRPEGFANDSFQAIALNRHSAVLLGDREAEPGAFPAIFPRQDSEQFIPAPVCFFEDALIGIRVEQAIFSSEPLGA